MADQPWLQLDDQLLLDDVDYRVVATLAGRTDRLAFRLLTLVGQLRGERRLLLQTEDGLLDARAIEPGLLSGEQVQLHGRTFALLWDSDVRTERNSADSATQFGRGRCAWYAAEDDSVAVLIVERYEQVAFAGEPLEPSRIDLRFTEGLRERRQ